MKTKISVVIPTYKRPKLLIKCLTALSKQTLDGANFEVIVVSDGPDPETHNQIQPWVRSETIRVSYIQTSEKKGPAAARNLGWRSSIHPLIAFTDDDCLPEPDWLENFLNFYKGETLVAYSGFTYVPLSSQPSDYELNIAHLQSANFITANCACTAKALKAVNGFDERFETAWREDSDLEFKLITNRIPIIKVQAARVVHPVRQVPWGISIKEQKKGIYDALLYKKYPSLYRSKIQSRPLWNYYLINILWVAILALILSYPTPWLYPIVLLQIILISAFIVKRLRYSKKSVSHILEMIGTSLIIPSLSVFWRIYGAIKYRVFLF